MPNQGWLAAHPPPGRVFPAPSGDDGYTVEDWLKIPEVGEQVELIDGSFVVSPMPGLDHACAATRLIRILDEACPDRYEVVSGSVHVGADGLCPDLVIGEAEAMTTGALMLTAAEIACVGEIARRGRRRQQEVKPSKYAAAGIPVFVRVELHGVGAPRAEVFKLGRKGYEPVAEAAAGGMLTIDEPFPVSFDPAWLTGPRRRPG
ncbi:MAG TPA: Uma2 family endonuclease [Nonomuraea sp.]|nr:Uma2 family endonuclease [Nonomuraea sp.]